jgi:hypothetical protein
VWRLGRPGEACGVNAAVKVPCLVAGMAAGADSIDDMGPVATRRDERLVRRDPRPVHARLAPALLYLGERRPAGEGEPGVPRGWALCPSAHRHCRDPGTLHRELPRTVENCRDLSRRSTGMHGIFPLVNKTDAQDPAYRPSQHCSPGYEPLWSAQWVTQITGRRAIWVSG